MAVRLACWQRAADTLASQGVLNLAIGQPALSLLPTELVQRAAAAAIGLPGATGVDPRLWLQYGPSAGNAGYLVALTAFLSKAYGYKVRSECLFETNGNSYGLDIAAQVLTAPGDAALVEDPSYFLAFSILEDDNRLELIPALHCDRALRPGRTVDVDALTQTLAARAAANQPMPKIMYLVPTGANPCGQTMPDGDRKRLVELCAQHAVTIIADDVYELLSWAAHRPKSMRQHAMELGCSGTVVSIGTFSKLLGPGLRLGWIEADPDVVEKLCSVGVIRSGGGVNVFTDTVVTAALTSGDVDRHRAQLCAALQRRSTALADAINGEIPEEHRPVVAAADSGYFLWVNMAHLDAERVQATCLANHKVDFLPGKYCSIGAPDAVHYGRVSFAFLEDNELADAGQRLGKALAQALAQPRPA